MRRMNGGGCHAEALAKADRLHFVYIIESESSPGRFYVGSTTDLDRRFEEHNSGKSTHTAKFTPWRLVTYIAFSDQALIKQRRFALRAILNQAPEEPLRRDTFSGAEAGSRQITPSASAKASAGCNCGT